MIEIIVGATMMIGATCGPAGGTADELAALGWTPVEVEATGYVDEDGVPPYGITASGARTGPGTVAAPPEVPFGTRVYVPGYGYGTVEDRGGAIRGRRIDLWFERRSDALEWGRRKVVIYVEPGVDWPEGRRRR